MTISDKHKGVRCEVKLLIVNKLKPDMKSWVHYSYFDVGIHTLKQMNDYAYELTPDPNKLHVDVIAVKTTGVINNVAVINIIRRRSLDIHTPNQNQKQKLVPYIIAL